MATIVKGTTFTTTVTAGGMHTLVESATISAITRTSMRITEASLVTRATTEPTGASAREVWQPSPGNGLATYDAVNAKWLAGLPQFVPFVAGAQSIAAGDLLESDSSIDEIIASPAQVFQTNPIFGVSLTAVAAGGRGIAVTKGVTKIALTGTVAAGRSLSGPTVTAGKALGITTLGTGYGIGVVAIALEADSGGFVWAALRR